MKAIGNGTIEQCVQNLLAIVRGEVCYDRLRGLDARNIDKPAGEAAELIREDAVWELETYEPRADVRRVLVTAESSAEGRFSVTAELE